jgi:hypothetical protein
MVEVRNTESVSSIQLMMKTTYAGISQGEYHMCWMVEDYPRECTMSSKSWYALFSKHRVLTSRAFIGKGKP